MKAFIAFLALFLAVNVNANFYIWKVDLQTSFSGNDRWNVVQQDSDMKCLENYVAVGRSDVSGNKLGVRTVGKYSVRDHPDQISEMEMHWGEWPKTHWSMLHRLTPALMNLTCGISSSLSEPWY
jgi:hypothetical protein